MQSLKRGHNSRLQQQQQQQPIFQVDPDAKVACETCIKTGMVMIFGEISSKAAIDHVKVIRETVKRVGYNHSSVGFDATTCNVIIAIDQQSPDIAQGESEAE